MTSANWQKGDLIIRNEALFANGSSIRLADIVLATADKSTRPTAASNRAFLIMAGSAVLAATLIAFIPPVGGLLIGIALIAWFLAWRLRASCCKVHIEDMRGHRTAVTLNGSDDASEFLRALSDATGGRVDGGAVVDTPRERRRI